MRFKSFIKSVSSSIFHFATFPKILLQTISCRCKTTWGKMCGCRRGGFKCFVLCHNWGREMCANVVAIREDDDGIDGNGNIQSNQSSPTLLRFGRKISIFTRKNQSSQIWQDHRLNIQNRHNSNFVGLSKMYVRKNKCQLFSPYSSRNGSYFPFTVTGLPKISILQEKVVIDDTANFIPDRLYVTIDNKLYNAIIELPPSHFGSGYESIGPREKRREPNL